MTLKLTRRRNGKYLATIRIAYHIDKDAAAAALAVYRDAELIDINDPTASKAMVELAIRNCCYNNGADWQMAAGDLLDEVDNGDELKAWATAEIERLYPEWRS